MNKTSKNNDDDTIPVKPKTLVLYVLSSAGAGLAAGLFVSWIFCNNGNIRNDACNDNQEASVAVPIISDDS